MCPFSLPLPGMSDSKANARGLKANAADPEDELPVVSAALWKFTGLYVFIFINCKLGTPPQSNTVQNKLLWVFP